MQGEVETRRALEELRKYCNSPDFSAWKPVSRIQSPKRYCPGRVVVSLGKSGESCLAQWNGF